MHLRAPSHLNETFKVSAQNLIQILATKNRTKPDPEQFITKVASLALKDIQNAHLGWGHYIKKHAMGAAVHGTILAAPVAGTIGGVYYYSDKIRQIDPTNAVQVGAAFAGAYAADFVVGKILGVRPITAAVFTLYDILREGARRVSKEVMTSYTRKEEQMLEVIKESREKIKQELIVTYKGVGEELVNRYKRTCNDPISLGEMQGQVKMLGTKLPLIEKSLGCIEELSSTDITEILHPIKEVVEFIGSNNMTFRETQNEEDKEYNAKLMAQFSDEEFADNVFSENVRQYIENANKNRLGFGHTVKAYASSLVTGCAALVTIPALSAFLAYAGEVQGGVATGWKESVKQLFQGVVSEQTKPVAIAAGIVGLATLAVTARVSSDRFKTYTDERDEAEAIIQENISAAIRELQGIYDGIAEYIAKNPNQELATKIRSKIPTLHAQVNEIGLMNSLELTKKLRSSLENVPKQVQQQAA